MRLSVRSALPDQEMTTSFRYWEGAVVVAGESNGKPVSGKGYAELTGYDR
jgi:predicted secreted hydrolase